MAPMSNYVQALQTELVTINVGQGNSMKTYQFQKGLLCRKFPWFQMALADGRFREGATNKVSMPDDPPRAFEAAIYFLLEGKLEFGAWPVTSYGRSDQILECLDIWMFGEKYGLPALQDGVTRRACSLFCRPGFEDIPIDTDTLITCFMTTSRPPAFRTLAIDYVVDRVGADDGIVGAGALATVPGFMAEYLAVGKMSDKLELHSFPRGKKPRGFRGVFSAQLLYDLEEYDDKYDGVWARSDLPYTCDQCGAKAVRKRFARCGACEEPGCREGCGERDMVMVCRHCKEDEGDLEAERMNRMMMWEF